MGFRNGSVLFLGDVGRIIRSQGIQGFFHNGNRWYVGKYRGEVPIQF